MFDFLSDDVFQIVVITALFVIGVMLFMLYKRPSENISQYLDDIDYRIDKMNKKLDELTNTFVNGLIVDEEESDTSSVNGQSNEEPEHVQEVQEVQEVHADQEVQEVQEDDDLNTIHNKEIKSLNYEGIEFSDIPNFSTDTSVLDEDVIKIQEPSEQPEQPEQPEEINGKKRVNIIKRIIQSEE
jgi:hypothetical protein